MIYALFPLTNQETIYLEECQLNLLCHRQCGSLLKKIKIHEQFGYVVWSSLIETEEQGYILKPTRVLSFLPDRTLIDVPRIIANTDIQQGLRKVSCVDND